LVNFARRQQGCQALQRHYGIGWLCAAIIWAEIGDARRFRSSATGDVREPTAGIS
jgi:transposase